MYRKSLILLILAVFLGGCAMFRQPLTPEYKQSIKNMLVVSVMGDSFRGIKIGTIILNNDHFEEDFSDFVIDKKIEESIVRYLESYSGIKGLTMPNLKEDFRGAFGYKSQPKKWLERLGPLLKDLKAEGIDCVLVISPSWCQFEDTTVNISGYGIAVRSFLMLWHAKAYFISDLRLIDTSTQKMVFNCPNWWQKEIEFSVWQKSFSKLTSAEQKATKDFFNDIIDSYIPKFLKKFNF